MSELLFDLSRDELYVANSAYVLGRVQRTLSELSEQGLLASSVEWLEKAGYRCNRCAGPEASLIDFTSELFATLLSRCSRPGALLVHHSYAENTSITPLPDNRELLARANYFPVNLLRHFGMDNMPYLGSYSSGCTGFMSLVLLAAGVLRSKGVEEVICLTTDLKPREATYDSTRERLLTSDAASGFIAGREKRGYQVMGIGQYSSSRPLIPLVEVVKRSVFLTKSLLELTGLSGSGVELLCHYPNMFTQGWQMVSHFLKVAPANQFIDEMAERAHCLSSDAIITLEKARGTPGRIHVVYSFGSGLHLAVAILKEI